LTFPVYVPAAAVDGTVNLTVHDSVWSLPEGPPVEKARLAGEVENHADGMGFPPVPENNGVAVKLPLFFGAVID